MGNRRRITKPMLFAEIGSRLIVCGFVLIAIILAATSVYPRGFTVTYITGAIALIVEFFLVLRAIFYLVKPNVYNLTNARAALLLSVQIILLSLFIVAAVFAFRGFETTRSYDSQAQSAVYSIRIAAGVLIMASIAFQIVPTVIIIRKIHHNRMDDKMATEKPIATTSAN